MPTESYEHLLGRPCPFLYLSIAAGEVGQREILGPGDNPRIVEYHSSTKLCATDDETPWCASFVNWCLEKSGIEGTASARALSFLAWGVPCGPRLGAVAVIDHGGGKGHVGFPVGFDPQGRHVLLGGNQGNMVSYKALPRKQVAFFRWPIVPLPTFAVDGIIGNTR